MNINITDPSFILIIFGVLAIVTELLLGVSTGFDLFLIGVAFMIGGSVGIALHSFPLSLVVVIVLVVLYLVIGRRFIKDKLTIETKSTNVDNIMGKNATVTKKIGKGETGQVKIEGEIWRATSKEDIDIGETVIIQSVSGVTLQVEKK